MRGPTSDSSSDSTEGAAPLSDPAPRVGDMQALRPDQHPADPESVPTALSPGGALPPLPPASEDRLGPPDVPAVFAPPADTWRRVSPKLITVRRISSSITFAVLALITAVPVWFIWEQAWAAAIPLVVFFLWWLWAWIRAGRVVRAIGYAEREADLCVTEGLWFKHLLVVPFGRMQVVKVSSGPLLRAHGLATVELVTASATTDATIPGLPLEEARILRDRLIELSDAKGSGL